MHDGGTMPGKKGLPGNQRTSGIIILLCCAVMWSFGGLVIKTSPLSPLAICGIRSLFGLAPLAFFIRPRFSFTLQLLICGLCYSAATLAYAFSVKMSTAANAIFLYYTFPFFTPLLAVLFYRQKASKQDLLFLAVSFICMAALFWGKADPTRISGNLLGLASGFSMAVYVLLSRRLDDRQSVAALVLGNVVNVLVSIPVLVSVPISMESGGVLALAGVFQFGLPYMLFTLGIRRVSQTEGTLVPMLEIVLSPMWVFLFQGEFPGWIAVAGGTVLIICVIAKTLMKPSEMKQAKAVTKVSAFW
jgi:drug/metabolite transporter (DMT)-like permease